MRDDQSPQPTESPKIHEDWPDLIIASESYIAICKNKKFQIVKHEDGFKFYGITWNNNDVYYCNNNSIAKNYQNYDAPYVASLGGHMDVHQLLFYESLLYATLARNNEVREFVVGLQINKRRTWPEFVSEAKEHQDYTHINSIFIQNRKVYLCHHNNGKPSFISVHEKSKYMPIVDTVEDVGLYNHNVYVEGDYLYTLDSGNCKITKINLKTKGKEQVDLNPQKCRTNPNATFLRGLARTEKYFVIGACQNLPKLERHKEKSFLILLDSNLNFVDSMAIPYADQVRDIRVIGEMDLAHNGILYPFEY
jgi:hypothetical protein